MTEFLNRPILAVSVAVWSGEQVLLVRRRKAPNKGLWALPGGKVEFGENLASAAIREMREETGLAIIPKDLFLIQDILVEEAHFSLHCIAAVAISGELVAASDAADAKWINETELPQMEPELVPELRTTVAMSKHGPFLPL
ncbi:MAG: NUDIX domain-containing protein [Hyphomicrobiales bacterium]